MPAIQRRSTVFLTTATAACAALSAPVPVTLRYIYKPGQVSTFTFSDTSSSAVQSTGKPAVTEWTQTAEGVVRKTVVSGSRDRGVVEETTVKGSVERTDSRGSTSQVLPAGTRRYAFDRLGKLMKMERIGPAGQADTRPQPLDGFTFSLSEKPVSPGAKWTESIHVVGLDGKPVTIAATSTYRGDKQRAGHPASQIDVAFTGAFTSVQAGSSAPAKGSLSGAITYFLARDIGQEVESTSDMTIILAGATAAGGKSEPVVRTLRFHQTRKLAK